jgi:hypothetical protein
MTDSCADITIETDWGIWPDDVPPAGSRPITCMAYLIRRAQLVENGYSNHPVAFESAFFQFGNMFYPQLVMAGQSCSVRGRKKIHIQFLPDLNHGQKFGIRPHDDTCPVG